VAAEVDIVNKALLLLGEGLVTSGQLTTPDDDSSRTMAGLLAQARRAVLRDCKPNCARRYAVPAAAVSPPVNPDYVYAFDLPADCLRVVRVLDGASGTVIEGIGALVITRWRVAGRWLLVDYTPVAIEYVTDLATASFDTLLDDALAHYLAWQAAPALTDAGSTRIQSLQDQYQTARFLAMGTDEIEGQVERFDSADRLSLARHTRY
jgi:hypothetical protein